MSIASKNHLINNNCTNRIKPTMLRDVKTEALLVLSRTALERYFLEISATSGEATFEKDEDAIYVYDTLNTLLLKLQEHVVNVDYLIKLAEHTSKYPQFQSLNKLEEPLVEYYNVMAQKVKNHYDGKYVYLPVFLVICVLSGWIDGEEKSTRLYPFLDEVDFLELMGKFENKRELFFHGDTCKITEIHELSYAIVEKLKKHKYKVNKKRVSKNRKK